MQVGVVRVVPSGRVVRPDELVAMRRDDEALRDEILEFVPEIVREVISPEVGRRCAGIVQLEPVVVPVVVIRVQQRAGVRRHPFVDEDDDGRGGGVVGARWRDAKEFLLRERLAIGELPVAAPRGKIRVVQVIEHLRRAARRPDKPDGTDSGCGAEVRVPFGGRGLVGLGIAEHEAEFSRLQHRTRRERPLREVGVIVRQVIAGEAEDVGAGVVDFDPRFALAEVVRDPGHVIRLDFVQPNGGERGQGRGDGVDTSGGEGRGTIVNRGEAPERNGETVVQARAVGAGQHPETQRVGAGVAEAQASLRGVTPWPAHSAADDVQAVASRLGDAGGHHRVSMVAEQSPRSQTVLEAAILKEIGADRRHRPGDEDDIVHIDVTGRG